MTYFKGKHFLPLWKVIFQILEHKTPIKEESSQNIENYLLYNILRILFLIQSCMMQISFQKKFKITVP
jgi:hypothetical protein